MDQSQPETEMFPPQSVPSEEQPDRENEVSQTEPAPHEVPVPEWESDNEDAFCALGNALNSPEVVAGVWEI